MSRDPHAAADALVCDGATGVVLRELRLADPRPSDVVIRSAISGISTGTDRWVMQGRFVWRDIKYPVVPGYQAAGVVAAVGSAVDRFSVGQAVATTAGRDLIDVPSAWGTHASMIVADDRDVYDATGIPPLRAAFIVSAQVGYNAASRIDLPAGSRVLVVGDGIIGSSAALAAAARGFDVLAMGRHPERLSGLGNLGLPGLAVRESGPTARAVVAEFAPLAVIDTVQSDAAFATYIDALPRATGQLVYSGHSPGGVTAWADMAVLQKREQTVHFVAGMLPHRLEATLGLMRDGRMPTDRLVGEIADSPAAAVRLMSTVASGHLGPVAGAIDWSWSG